MKKLNIDIAERKASVLRRRLCSADRLSDAAMARALDFLNTSGSRSSALLLDVTRADQRRDEVGFRFVVAMRGGRARHAPKNA
jgi:hypothetical protein